MDLKDYKLVWSDEFDGDRLDTTKWTISEDDTPLKNADGELTVIYGGEKESVWVENGCLYLLNRYDENSGLFLAPKSVQTKKTMSFKYGYVEVRAKLPFVAGTEAALKALAKNAIGSEKNSDYYSQMNLFQYEGSAYNVGSRIIKVYENYNENNPYYKLNMWGRDMGPMDTSSKAQLDGLMTPDSFRSNFTPDKKDEFLTYGFLWTPEIIEVFVEGRKISRINLSRDFLRESGIEGFRQPHYLEFQNTLKVGRMLERALIGFKKAEEDIASVSENLKHASAKADYIKKQYPFEIDYVRLYQRDGEGELNIN